MCLDVTSISSQVYLKLANEDEYVAAFGPAGEVRVTLRDSSIGADQLAREARDRGLAAVVESLLFYLASNHGDAVLRLLVCAFELFGAPASTHVTTALRTKACRRVVAALTNFTGDARVQLAGVSAVVNLAVDAVGRRALAEFGACEAVLRAVTTHGFSSKDDPDHAWRRSEVRHVGVEAVTNLLPDDANAAQLAALDAPKVLLRLVAELEDTGGAAPRRRSRDRRVAARAWSSLARLAAVRHGRDHDDGAASDALSGDDAALKVLTCATGALDLLDDATGDDGFEDPQAAGDEDALDTAALLYGKSPTTPPDEAPARGAGALLSACCHAIQAFAAADAALAGTLVGADAPRVLERSIKRALRASASSDANQSRGGYELARRACAATMALAATGDGARGALGAGDVCAAVVTVVRDLCGDEGPLPLATDDRLRYYAVGALLNLAFSSPKNRDDLAAHDVLAAVAACAAAAAADLDMQRLCCRAFWILATPPDKADAAATPRKPLEDAKLAVVPRAMLTYEADQQLQHFACGAVINLAATSSAMRRARVPPRPLLRPPSLRKPASPFLGSAASTPAAPSPSASRTTRATRGSRSTAAAPRSTSRAETRRTRTSSTASASARSPRRPRPSFPRRPPSPRGPTGSSASCEALSFAPSLPRTAS